MKRVGPRGSGHCQNYQWSRAVFGALCVDDCIGFEQPEFWLPLLLPVQGNRRFEQFVYRHDVLRTRSRQLHGDDRGTKCRIQQCGRRPTSGVVFANQGYPHVQPCRRARDRSFQQLDRGPAGVFDRSRVSSRSISAVERDRCGFRPTARARDRRTRAAHLG